MNKFISYQCSVCNRNYQPQKVQYTCPEDGGNLDVLLDYEKIRSTVLVEEILNSPDRSIWRYLPLLPVNEPGYEDTPLRSVGWTPLYESRNLVKKLGLKQLWLKDDGRNPSASFKDRASAVVVVRAKEIGAKVIVTASSGNAGAALANMAAAANHHAVIFAPKSAPIAKIAQMQVFGADVLLVDGNYDQAFDLSIEAADEFGWYCRNTGYNPFTAEGKKTAAFEIWEQVIFSGNLKRPLNIFVPVGDGNIISGIHKGFKDLIEIGWLDHMPRIFGVQSEGSAAVANAFFSGTESIEPVNATTLADSISVNLPRDGLRAVRAVTQTGGRYITVSDKAIIECIAWLGREGIFVEPAASAAFAGLRKAVEEELIEPADPVLVMLTGSGLKDIKSATMSIAMAPIIQPSLEAVKSSLNL